MGVAGAGRVEGVGALVRGDLEHLTGGHVQDLGVGVDEAADQPGQAIRSVFGRSLVTHFMAWTLRTAM